ncbi:MAG: hypothetical protein ABFC42_12885 [Sulfuricella sp.]
MPKRFADFAEESSPLDGDKIKLEEVINIELRIIGYNIRRSKYEKNRSGKCLLLQIEHDGKHRVIFTGSDVLIEQMEKYGAEVPFATTIKKIDRYYTLS